MKRFMDQDYELFNETGKRLFHTYAENLPIIDYHCHVNPKEIAEDAHYRDIAELWLGGDHYKWRAMRSNGIPEKYCTGSDTTGKEKFLKFTETLERAIGNPLYAWSHMELKKYFGYEGVLNSETAEAVWNLTTERCKDLSCRKIIEMSNVESLCTTDDPVDSLEYHKAIAADASFKTKVLPTFRPDKILNLRAAGYAEYIGKLETVSNVKITDMESLKQAICIRMDHFGAHGCKVADHGITNVPFVKADESELNVIFKKAMGGENITDREDDAFRTALLLFCGNEYAKRGWAMQIHFSALRNPNQRMFRLLGPDTGFDTIGQTQSIEGLAALLDGMMAEGLPKVILYSLNPNDLLPLATLAGSFQDESARGKIQLGSGWWFNDTLPGMRDQLTAYANESVLANFIGMLTDSRSFLSYTRHDYFRRLFCNFIGEYVESGRYPEDERMLRTIVEGVSYRNAKEYLNL